MSNPSQHAVVCVTHDQLELALWFSLLKLCVVDARGNKKKAFRVFIAKWGWSQVHEGARERIRKVATQ